MFTVHLVPPCHVTLVCRQSRRRRNLSRKRVISAKRCRVWPNRALLSAKQAVCGGGEDDTEPEDSGFDTHVLKKAVNRFINSCKSLMLEYENGCKERAARAIMDWSLLSLAQIGLARLALAQ